MKKKICIIDNSISFTGAFKCAITEATLLSNQFEFIFIVPEKSSVIERLKAGNFCFYTLPMQEISRSAKGLFLYGPKLLINAYKLKRILLKEEVIVLQLNDFYNLLGVSVKLLGYNGKLITYVRFLPASIPSLLRTFWTSLALKYSNAVIAVSDAVLKQLPSHSNTIKIYDAINLPETNLHSVIKEDQRITFLYLANYIRGKGQEYALRAMLTATKKNQYLFLKFVGSDMGLEKNRIFKTELEEFVKENNLEAYVSFESFSANIECKIKESDVILNFSDAESFSMTCAEASYYSRPVIATRCGGPEEIIKHCKTGVLVDKQNIDQMVDAMLLLANRSDLRKEYGNAGHQFIKKQFSTDYYIQQFTSLIDAINK